jgi:hypothetical protein
MNAILPATSHTLAARVCGAVITPASFGIPQILEFASTDLLLNDNKVVGSTDIKNSRFEPLGPLPPPEEIAGLCEIDFHAAEPWDDSLADVISNPVRPRYFVAHGASRLAMLLPSPPAVNLGWICTKKLAMHFWPNAPGYNLLDLLAWRPWPGAEGVVGMDDHPERAAATARLSASLLIHLLKGVTLRHLVHLSTWIIKPTSPPPEPFDQMAWSSTPIDEVRFFASHFNGMPAFVQRRARMEIAHRKKLAVCVRRLKQVLPIQ